MRIVLLNGNPQVANQAIETHLSDLRKRLEAGSHVVRQLDLREMDIHYCVGCFGCWVKTPGECTVSDESQEVRRAVIKSDLVLFASPVIMGFISAVLKQMLDKLIPLVHPYLEIDHGEIHHRKRYKDYPVLGLLLEKGSDTDAEDLEIIEQSFRRLAINFKTRLGFTCLTSQPLEEIVDEINRL